MTNRLKTTATTCLSATALFAAGLAYSAPAAAQQQESPFEGFHVGVNGGVAWSDTSGTATLGTTSTTPTVAPPIAGGTVTTLSASSKIGGHHATGFTGGLEGGYDYVSNHNGLLIGIETDIDLYHMHNSGTATAQSGGATYTVSQDAKTDWMWTLRPRIGWAGGRFEVYGTGGLAMTNVKYRAALTDSLTPADNITLAKDQTKTGWVIGAGAGYALGSKMVLKGEYLYEDYGTDSQHATSVNGFYTLSGAAHFKSHLFRAGLDYKL